jgi:hypothetical protein
VETSIPVILRRGLSCVKDGATLNASSLPEHLYTAAMASALARLTQRPNTKKQLDQHGYFKVEAI